MNVSISQRILGLTRKSISMIIAVSLMGIVACAVLKIMSVRYSNLASVQQVQVAMLEDVLEARLSALEYQVDPTDEAVESVYHNISDVRTDAAKLQAAVGEGSDLAASMPSFLDSVDTFEHAFELFAVDQDEIDATTQKIVETGKTARETLSSFINLAMRDGTTDMTIQAGRAQQSLLLTRLYLERYKKSSKQADIDVALGHLVASQDHLTAILATTNLSQLRSALTTVQDKITELDSAATHLQRYTRLRLSAADSLDRIGPAMLQEIEQNVESIDTRLSELGQSMATIAYTTIGLLLTSCLGALLFAWRSSQRISSNIVEELEIFVGNMTDLAQGNHNIEITGVNQETELGRMSGALEIFKTSLQEHEALTKAEAENNVARQREEQERIAAERQAQEAADEEARAVRAKMMAQLDSSIGAVVLAASQGDFSRQVEDQFDDPTLQGIVSNINTLMTSTGAWIDEASTIIRNISQGDLTQKMTGKYSGAFAEMQVNINDTTQSLSTLIAEILGACDDLGHQANQMSQGADSLSRSAEQQASALVQTTAATEQLSANAQSGAANAESTQTIARAASDKVDEAGSVVSTAVQSMEGVKKASDSIAKFVNVIEGIAYQTNLLALNAAVEAARAGEAGRGFAVVAAEVRALAQRASESSNDIRDLIEVSSTEIDTGVKYVSATGSALTDVVAHVRDMAGDVASLAEACRAQATGVGEMSSALLEIDRNTQSTVSLAENSRADSANLSRAATQLRDLLAKFQVPDMPQRKAA